MLKRKFRLRSKSGFQAIFENGENYSVKHVAIYILKGPKKFGFIASKKVGNSVQRNRARRLMREVVRLHMSEIRNDIQIIFIARVRIRGVSYMEVEKSMMNMLKRANALVKRE
ncbi:ribonuclease P protein component [Desulfosporosinus metallidurans]|uniref:Ribonuclease P protein component n=1 Tax=Desulfosporosinus metallidurans TaxID=1888891 RepID=A0A1Q8R3E7_9FIRM|nr:ribonuclease P protein component [Desulfosporosinus metallidurans]OLN34031.1 Ribonuclease P protein component [Desulfosporosinus metallidurans]